VDGGWRLEATGKKRKKKTEEQKEERRKQKAKANRAERAARVTDGRLATTEPEGEVWSGIEAPKGRGLSRH
jgi:NADH:ubiquinone oxidoreductase subunit D